MNVRFIQSNDFELKAVERKLASNPTTGGSEGATEQLELGEVGENIQGTLSRNKGLIAVSSNVDSSVVIPGMSVEDGQDPTKFQFASVNVGKARVPKRRAKVRASRTSNGQPKKIFIQGTNGDANLVFNWGILPKGQESGKGTLTIDGKIVDWTRKVKNVEKETHGDFGAHKAFDRAVVYEKTAAGKRGKKVGAYTREPYFAGPSPQKIARRKKKMNEDWGKEGIVIHIDHKQGTFSANVRVERKPGGPRKHLDPDRLKENVTETLQALDLGIGNVQGLSTLNHFGVVLK